MPKEMNIPYSPGLDGVPAAESAISYLDGERGILAYRGRSVFDLVEERMSFEKCAHLLIHGDDSDILDIGEFTRGLREAMRIPDSVVDVLDALPRELHPMEALSIGVVALANHYHQDISLAVRETGKEELSKHLALQAQACLGGVAAVVAAWERIRQGEAPLMPMNNDSFARNFLYLFTGREDLPEGYDDIIDLCLLLHAEHSLNASTFATMVTASTLAGCGLVLSTGVNTLAGPLHGGANERVIHMLDSIGSVDKVEAWLDDALANKRVVWGMGHREYKVKDPRAIILQRIVQAQVGSDSEDKSLEIALELEKQCEKRLAHKGVYPNVDYYSGILYRAVGIPIDQFTPFFAVSRTVGWMAHWIEQVMNNRIFRPTHIYTGKTVD